MKCWLDQINYEVKETKKKKLEKEKGESKKESLCS